MPINDIAHGLRRVGKLRMGEQVPTSKGGARPAKLDTWRITSADEHVIRSVADVYGGDVKPWDNDGTQEYEVVTATSTLDVLITPEPDSFSQWYELWKAGGCQRRCDGEVEQLSGNACMCPLDREARSEAAAKGQACKATTRVSVVLPLIPSIGSWMVESHGYYAAKELGSTFALLDMAGARRTLLPARLRIEQRVAKRDGETKRYGVPVFDIAMTLDSLVVGGSGPALPPAGVDPATGEIGAATDRELPPAGPVNSAKKAAARKASAPKSDAPHSIADRSAQVRANDPMSDALINSFRARIALLEPSNVELFKAAIGNAGMRWGDKRKASEGDTVHKLLAEVEGIQAASWEDRRKRVFAALEGFDPKLRADEKARHQFVKDATTHVAADQGGTTESTKTLTEAQATAVIDAAGGEDVVEQQELAS